MSGPRITIEYDVSEFCGRVTIDADEFEGMSVEQIRREIQDRVDEDSKANVAFHAENVEGTLKAIQDALVEVAKSKRDELVEQFEAGDFGDVEFTELALAAGIDLATIEKALQGQREGAL